MGAACPFPRAPGSLGPSIPIPTTLCTPRKREMTPLPSETALMGIYPPGGTGGPQLPPSSPSQSSSPPRWAEGSEAGPDPDGDGSECTGLGEGQRSGGGPALWLWFMGFPDLLEGGVSQSLLSDLGSLCSLSSPGHTDSEVGDRSCASAGGHPSAMARSPTSPLPSPQTPSPTLLSPDLPSLDLAPCDLLGSRLERE